MIFREGAFVSAPCTERVHDGPSITEEMVPLGIHFRGSKNSDFSNEGNGNTKDSRGRMSRPLIGILGCNDPQ